MTHEEIQILISAYADGEVTPSERNIAEEHLRTCESCQKDFKTYKAMSSSLSKWSNEALSPDEEINVQRRMEQRREPMFTKRTATIFVTTLCLTLVIGSVMQTYIKRGVHGRAKYSPNDIGDQYVRGGNSIIHIEPYYVNSRSGLASIDKNEKGSEKKLIPEGFMMNQSAGRVVMSASAQSLKTPASMQLAGLTSEDKPANYYQTSDAYYAAEEERKKIQRADITLLVDNAFKTKLQLTELILGFNGIIENSVFNRSDDGSGQGTMVCKVYPKDLEHALQQIRKLGEVEVENEGSQDVTDQYKDAQKNVTQYTSDKERLQKSLNNFKLFNPTTDAERENIKRQIEETQDQIKSLERMIKFFQDQTSMSVIVVNYHDHYKRPVNQNESSNSWKSMFENKWKTTANDSMEVITTILFGSIYLLSFMAPILLWSVIFWVIYLIISKFFIK